MNKLIGLYLLILSFSASSIDLSPINNQDWTHEKMLGIYYHDLALAQHPTK